MEYADRTGNEHPSFLIYEPETPAIMIYMIKTYYMRVCLHNAYVCINVLMNSTPHWYVQESLLPN